MPYWLTPKYGEHVHKGKKRRFVESVKVIPQAVKAIRKIFRLKLAGAGYGTIEHKLNTSGAWQPPINPKRKTTGWRRSYIRKILQSRAVIGEFQPHKGRGTKRKAEGDPIPDYFPTIVAPDVFNAVQAKFKAKETTAGRTGKALNILRGIAKCGLCGGPMEMKNGGQGEVWSCNYFCNNARRKIKCESHGIRQAEVDDLVLDNCIGLRPEQILPAADEQTKAAARLRTRIAGRTSEAEQIGPQVDNLVAHIERTKDPAMADLYERRIQKLVARRKELEQEVAEARLELERSTASAKTFVAWQTDLKALRTAIKAEGRTESKSASGCWRTSAS